MNKLINRKKIILNLISKKNCLFKSIRNESSSSFIQNNLLEVNESEKVLYFRKVSSMIDVLFDKCQQLKWIENSKNRKVTDSFELILKFNEFNPILINLIDKINSLPEFESVNEYFMQNLEKLNAKELAILFRAMNLLEKNNKTNELLLKIERNYYSKLNEFDLNDLVNFHRGLFMLRKPYPQSKVDSFSKSADLVHRKILSYLEEDNKQKVFYLDNHFPSLNLTLNGLPLVLTSIRIYTSMFTVETQIKYFESLIEKATALSKSKHDLSQLADLFAGLDKIFIQNLNKTHQILKSYGKYKNLFEQNYELILGNLDSLCELERFEAFLKSFVIFSNSLKKKMNSVYLIDFLTDKLIKSQDSQSVYKYIYSIGFVRKFFKNVNSKNDSDLDRLISEKAKCIIENMDFYSTNRLLSVLDKKYFNFEPNNSTLLEQTLNRNLENDEFLCSFAYNFPIFFNSNTGDKLKASPVFPKYCFANRKYFQDNFELILDFYEANFKTYLFDDQSNLSEFVDNLKFMPNLKDHSEKLKNILRKSCEYFLQSIILNEFEKIKPIDQKSIEDLDFTKINYEFKSVKKCLKAFNFLNNFVFVLQENSIRMEYLNLDSLDLSNFKTMIKNYKDIFSYFKSKLSTPLTLEQDENVMEFLKFDSLKIVKYLFLLAKMVKISNYYSPKLNKELIEIFTDVADLICDPHFEKIGLNQTRVHSTYEFLFRFTELYKLYDLDCPEAQIEQELKTKLKNQLNYIYKKIRNKINPKDTVFFNYWLVNLNILNPEAIEDFQSVLMNKSNYLVRFFKKSLFLRFIKKFV